MPVGIENGAFDEAQRWNTDRSRHLARDRLDHLVARCPHARDDAEHLVAERLGSPVVGGFDRVQFEAQQIDLEVRRTLEIAHHQ